MKQNVNKDVRKDSPMDAGKISNISNHVAFKSRFFTCITRIAKGRAF